GLSPGDQESLAPREVRDNACVRPETAPRFERADGPSSMWLFASPQSTVRGTAVGPRGTKRSDPSPARSSPDTPGRVCGAGRARRGHVRQPGQARPQRKFDRVPRGRSPTPRATHPRRECRGQEYRETRACARRIRPPPGLRSVGAREPVEPIWGDFCSALPTKLVRTIEAEPETYRHDGARAVMVGDTNCRA